MLPDCKVDRMTWALFVCVCVRWRSPKGSQSGLPNLNSTHHRQVIVNYIHMFIEFIGELLHLLIIKTNKDFMHLVRWIFIWLHWRTVSAAHMFIWSQRILSSHLYILSILSFPIRKTHPEFLFRSAQNSHAKLSQVETHLRNKTGLNSSKITWFTRFFMYTTPGTCELLVNVIFFVFVMTIDHPLWDRIFTIKYLQQLVNSYIHMHSIA